MTVAFRTRRACRILTVHLPSRRRFGVTRTEAGCVLCGPGFVYVVTLGGWQGADSRFTVNGHGFGRWVIPAR